jgi:hypothetical protein
MGVIDIEVGPKGWERTEGATWVRSSDGFTVKARKREPTDSGVREDFIDVGGLVDDPLASRFLGDTGNVRCSRGLRWLGMLAVLASTGLSGCASEEKCDPEAVKAFKSLPAVQGVEVNLLVSPGIGCTDTVQATDPQGFVSHYEKAMRDAGWTVQTEGGGVFGKGPSGGVRVDQLEGKDVGVYALSAEEY